ncbi:MAG: sigma-70 family RNA polymerase sigma factor [Planctomycetes bacterium]|nr:sigma-70 family RNA polymerase sigma factor [Planctomycetota bacterium]
MNAASAEELIRLAREGDREALGRLLEQYRAYLRLLAQRRLDAVAQARVDASDVVQQTCMEAHRDFAAFRGGHEGELLAWLRRILEHNAAHTIERHIYAQKRTLDREKPLDDSQSAAGPLLGRLAAEQTSPSRRAMLGEAAVRLAQALEHLPEDQREAVRLRHLEGWTLDQLTEHFQRSETAVAGLLKRGLRGLRSHFRGAGGQEAI